MSADHHRSTLDCFLIQGKLGAGTFGTVYKVIRKADGLEYALKEIDLVSMSPQEQEDCIKESQLMAALDSPYITKFYDSFLQKGKLYICMEYAPGGNLYDYIRAQGEPLPEEKVWQLFIQMLLGLNYMHGRKVLHRDFKTLNVFLDEQHHVRLGDLGVAKVLSAETLHAQTMIGTPYYLSPEMCEDKPYDQKSDVWALGVALYECCARRHPFDAENQGSLILKILRGKYPPLTGYSKELTAVVKGCLTQDASKRPSTNALLAHKSVRERAQQLNIELPPLPSKPPTTGASPPPTARPSRPSITAARSFQSRRSTKDASADPPTAAAAAAAAKPAGLSKSPTVGRTPSARLLAAVARVDIAAGAAVGLPERGPSPGIPSKAAAAAPGQLEKQVQGLKLKSPRAGGVTPPRSARTSVTDTGIPAAAELQQPPRTPSPDAAADAAEPLWQQVAAVGAQGDVGDGSRSCGSSPSRDATPPPLSDRSQRLLQTTLPAVKTQIIQLVGPLAYDNLRSIIMSAAQAADVVVTQGSRSTSESSSLLAAVQSVVPSPQAATVLPLLLKLMYLEAQVVDEGRAAAAAADCVTTGEGGGF